jgi:hypothetical protein
MFPPLASTVVYYFINKTLAECTTVYARTGIKKEVKLLVIKKSVVAGENLKLL